MNAAEMVAFLIEFHDRCDGEGLRHSSQCWEYEDRGWIGCELTAKVRELEKAHGLEPYVWVDPYPRKETTPDEFSRLLTGYWNEQTLKWLRAPSPFTDIRP